MSYALVYMKNNPGANRSRDCCQGPYKPKDRIWWSLCQLWTSGLKRKFLRKCRFGSLFHREGLVCHTNYCSTCWSPCSCRRVRITLRITGIFLNVWCRPASSVAGLWVLDNVFVPSELSATPEEISATQWQLDELDRRSAEYAQNPSSGIPLEGVKCNILSRSAQYHISLK